jgi:hypothetical protein
VLFAQVAGEVQSVAWVATVHEFLHTLLTQAKGVQSMGAGVSHVPWPSHCEAGVSEAPEQLEALQFCPLET